MSTALETDDESVNGSGSAGGDSGHITLLPNVADSEQFGKHILTTVRLPVKEKSSFKQVTDIKTPHSADNLLSSLTMIYGDRKRGQERQKLPFCFISTRASTCHQQIQWHLHQERLFELLKCQWFRRGLSTQLEGALLKANTLSCESTYLALAANQSLGSSKREKRVVGSVKPSQFLYLYLIYWQLRSAMEVTFASARPTHLRDLPHSQCASTSAKLVTCHQAAYHPNATFDLLSPSL